MPDKDSRLDTLDEASNALTSDGENGNHRLHTRLRSAAPIAPEAVRGAVSRGAVANAGEQCPTCTASIRGRFCSQCGEKAPSGRPWSVWAFVRKSFTSILEADNRFLRSLFLLIRIPGALTNDYLSGKRKPFMKPIQLFVVINVLFVILASNIGPDTFRTPLRYHVTSTNFYHQELAARWVNTAINAPDNWSYGAGQDAVMDREMVDQGAADVDSSYVTFAEAMDRFESYSARFNSNVSWLSESLVFVFIPCISIWFWGIRTLFSINVPRQRGVPRNPLADLVHATHVMTALLLVSVGAIAIGLVILILIEVIQMLADVRFRYFEVVASSIFDIAIFALMTTYLSLSLRRCWGISSFGALVGAVVTVLGLYQLLLFYRFLLFLLGFAMT